MDLATAPTAQPMGTPFLFFFLALPFFLIFIIPFLNFPGSKGTGRLSWVDQNIVIGRGSERHSLDDGCIGSCRSIV